ncbi:alpha/beta hydrolase [Actinotalea sp. M2MS4P-6]|uniref:alpha/beta fold hydrolase n=1 Tax=Actinotalea sp. M2MS4P-6 TaxID=2983762 RepID=UPI0021E440E6|nr:alpha/beta hydrolase [Actinotalea sp. M2MS4P-6]MCV2393738.1 alpha/beta hydrolase [Actinotalea sp. M2MS4P-6]
MADDAAAPRPRRTRSRGAKVGIALGATAGVLVLAGLVAFVVVKHKVDTYVDPWAQKVTDAGYVAKRAQVNQVDFSYVEGPDNGTPLVLLHAQLMDWFDYSRVMPALAESYHVYVVDYQGHGETTYPDDYPMTANQIGADLGDFIAQVVGEPAYVSGNSSGGLLTVWLAANRPELVEAIVLEDPPLFAAEYPRIKQTIADKAFASSYAAATEGDDGDFLLYWLDYNTRFFDTYVFPGSSGVITYFVGSYREANPGEPVELGIIPNETVKLLMRGLEEYDPRFGAAFYDGTWNEGFDHAEALSEITCPTLLLHADFSWTEDGILDGAMSQEDADRAMSLLSDGTYLRVDSSHVIHLEEPEEFVRVVDDFLLGEQG